MQSADHLENEYRGQSVQGRWVEKPCDLIEAQELQPGRVFLEGGDDRPRVPEVTGRHEGLRHETLNHRRGSRASRSSGPSRPWASPSPSSTPPEPRQTARFALDRSLKTLTFTGSTLMPAGLWASSGS